MGDLLALAVQQLHEGHLGHAEASCRELLAADSGNPAALHLLGFVSHLRGDDRQAAEYLSRAVVAAPTNAIYHTDLGGFQYRAGHVAEAALSLEHAVRLAPGIAVAHERLAILRAEQGRLAEAATAAGGALRSVGNDPDLLNRLGVTLLLTGVRDAARECFEHILTLEPNHADAHAGLGAVLLSEGNLERGWAEFEWRWRSAQMEAPRYAGAPRWTGEALGDRRLLVWAEQGLGDTLQFVRYATLLARHGVDVVVEVQPELERLVRHSLPEAEVIARGLQSPRFDVHAPLMSLPYLLGTRLDTIPAELPYLYAEEAADWLGPRDGRHRVGLVWAGNRHHTNDGRRSLDPNLLASLDGLGDIQWFSLQPGTTTSPPLDLVDWTADLTDFADTAALLMQLDLVVTVDTSIAHLAGALGRPVWILLPYAADWRWLVERSDSAWYPSARLYRQPAPGDWPSVVERVRADLAVLIGGV